MEIKELKLNPKNPRKIKMDKLSKLVNSIIEFPKMLSLRPVVYDLNKEILGGNMRLKAIQEIQSMGAEKVKEILQLKNNPANLAILAPIFEGKFPEGWVVCADSLTEEEKNRFIIEDNIEFGEWDEKTLKENWSTDSLNNWGLDIEDDSLEKNIAKYTNENCDYPIIPEYDEKYNAIVVICKSETEFARIKTLFDLPRKAQSYKNTFLGQTQVVDSEKIQKQ